MIYLTGSSGFIGQAILRRLKLSSKLSYLRLSRDLEPEIPANPLEYNSIVNCAWAGVLGSNRDSKVQTQNLKYTENLANYVIRNNIKHVVSFGSQAEYGNLTSISNEALPLNPLTLYGKTKVKSHNLLMDMLSPRGISLTWLRLYDPYGPGDNPKWFLPYLISCALEDVSPKLTACTQMWDYVYIDDIVQLIFAILASKPSSCSVYNVSSSHPVSLKYVVQTVFDIIKPPQALPIFGAVPFRDGQQHYVCGSNKKVNLNFGWAPETSIENGLRLTIQSMSPLSIC